MAAPTPIITELLFEMILDEVTDGRTLSAATRDYGVSLSMFYRYLDKDEARGQRFAEAVDRGADKMADDQLRIADDPTDSPQSRAVRCKARQWLLERRHASRYGAKIDINDNRNKKPMSLEQLYDTFTPAPSVDPSVTTH